MAATFVRRPAAPILQVLEVASSHWGHADGRLSDGIAESAALAASGCLSGLLVRTGYCSAGERSAGVLAAPGAAGQPGHVRATDQPIQARALRPARAGRVEVRRRIARSAIAAIAGAAVGAAVAPVAVARAGAAAARAAPAALPARRADSGSARRAGAAGAADQPMAAGVLRPGRAAASFVRAMVGRGRPPPAPPRKRGAGAGEAQAPQRPTPRERIAIGQSPRQRVESPVVHVRSPLHPALRRADPRTTLPRLSVAGERPRLGRRLAALRGTRRRRSVSEPGRRPAPARGPFRRPRPATADGRRSRHS